MPAKCTVCTHKKREEIDRSLIEDAESLRKVAKQYRLSVSSLHRHKEKHLPAALAEGKVAQEVGFANKILAKLAWAEHELNLIRNRAKRKGFLAIEINAIKEIHSVYVTLLKVSGQLKEQKIEFNLTLQFANSNVMKVYGAAFPGPAEALKVLLQKEYDGIPILDSHKQEGELFHS